MAASGREMDDNLSPEDVIFSCGMCQATIAEVYATKESNRGFCSDPGDDEGIVTKFWISECAHITCGKHLEGGAAPFHPKGARPMAPCPQCIEEKGDDSPKQLFGLRGLNDGEHDILIPPDWKRCPPIKLDDTISGMEALRFQYSNLLRNAVRVGRYWRETRRRVLALEVQLQKWEARKEAIHHYLAAVGEMAGEIQSMRSLLSDLGYRVSDKSYAFRPEGDARRSRTRRRYERSDPHSGQPRKINVTEGEKRTPSALAHSLTDLQALKHQSSSSSRKRNLPIYTPEHPDDDNNKKSKRRRSSRELMPPPLPKSASYGYFRDPVHLQEQRRQSASRHLAHVYEDSRWPLPRFELRLKGCGSREEHESGCVDEGLENEHAETRQGLPFRPSPLHSSATGIQSYDHPRAVAQNYLPPPMLQRSPTTSNYVQPQHISPTSDFASARSMRPLLARQNSYRQRPSLNGLSFIERPHRLADHQPLYQSPQPLANTIDSKSPPAVLPLLSNSQGLLQRPYIHQISRGRLPSRPQSNTYRGRITFPPNFHGSDLSRSDEQTLQHIPGVRGMTSHSACKYGNGPTCAYRRPVFTSAGGRRSVRR